MGEQVNVWSFAKDGILEVVNPSNGGIFSSSTTILRCIFEYGNRYNSLPKGFLINTMYFIYNPMETHTDYKVSHTEVYSHFFETNTDDIVITEQQMERMKNILHRDYQFDNYKTVPFSVICPFVRKYFSPSEEVRAILMEMERTYIEPRGGYENICLLFYRGNDKATETPICSYEEMKEKAEELQREHPNLIFLVQSDETAFLNEMTQHFANSFRFSDEYICHISDKSTAVQQVFSKQKNYEYAKKYIAITYIMSKCKHIIFTTGNCSIWTLYFRGDCENVHQHLDGRWV
jgi:hypothetical protein